MLYTLPPWQTYTINLPTVLTSQHSFRTRVLLVESLMLNPWATALYNDPAEAYLLCLVVSFGSCWLQLLILPLKHLHRLVCCTGLPEGTAQLFEIDSTTGSVRQKQKISRKDHRTIDLFIKVLLLLERHQLCWLLWGSNVCRFEFGVVRKRVVHVKPPTGERKTAASHCLCFSLLQYMQLSRWL